MTTIYTFEPTNIEANSAELADVLNSMSEKVEAVYMGQPVTMNVLRGVRVLPSGELHVDEDGRVGADRLIDLLSAKRS